MKLRRRYDAQTIAFIRLFARVYDRFLKLDATRQRQFFDLLVSETESEQDEDLRELYRYMQELFKLGMREEAAE